MTVSFARLLIAIATTIGIVSVTLPAATQSGCQNGGADVNFPYAGTTVPGTFLVSTQAVSYSPCGITRIRLYFDSHAYALSRAFDPRLGRNAVVPAEFYNVTLPQGYHNLVAVGYNNGGYGFASSATQVFVAPKDKTIYITAPVSGSVEGSRVVVGARARWDAPGGSRTYFPTQVQHMRVYVDNEDVYDTDAPQLLFQKSFAPGLHHMVVLAWNQSGHYIEASEYFTSK